MNSYRWTIEISFRFYKQLMGGSHLISHNANGIEFHAYCSATACLLTLWTGGKPSKRTFEMFSYCFTGLASEEELIAADHAPASTRLVSSLIDTALLVGFRARQRGLMHNCIYRRAFRSRQQQLNSVDCPNFLLAQATMQTLGMWHKSNALLSTK